MGKLLRRQPAKYHNYSNEKECTCTNCLKSRGEFEVYVQSDGQVLDDAIGQKLHGIITKPTKPLQELLIEHFGLGDDPGKRNALYARLSLLSERDKRVEALILEAVSMSEGKRDPAHYFAHSITLKLRECGVYSWPSK